MKKKVEIDTPQRIDQYLIDQLHLSRNKIQKMLKEQKIIVNGKPIKSSYQVKNEDIIDYEEYQEEEIKALPENIPLDIIYEDNDVIIINKANGMVVHPAVGNTHGTLVNALLYHAKSLSTQNGPFRPGIVHRIDADTTGLLMVAKNDQAHESLAKQLEEKTTTRIYYALVWGVIPNDTGTIDAPIGRDKTDRKKMAVTASNSKPSITHFQVLERYQKATLISLKLETGRTHQIRVHMNYIGHPIVNDPVYGKRPKIDNTGQCLHAKTIGFIHPTTNQYMEFTSELPPCFQNILKQFQL